MEVTFLGNGSSGNSTIVTDGTTTIMVDDGLPLKKTPVKADFLLLTHEHYDHLSNAKSYAKKYGIRITIDRMLCLTEQGKIPEEFLTYEDFTSIFTLNTIEVEPFSVVHDVPCFGFLFNREFLFMTDTGIIPFTVALRLKKYPTIKAIYIETNYDEKLMEESEYDPYLKARIKGRFGHLSNQDVLKYLSKNEALLTNIQYIVLGHLSENTNSQEMLLQRIDEMVSPELKKKILVGKNKIEF